MQLTIPRVITSVRAKVTVPGSKSITNRALLLAALAEGISVLKNVLLSDDTMTLIVALQNLGVQIELDRDHHTAKVIGCCGQFPQLFAKIDCRDAGTVARFLLAACANQTGRFELEGSARLCERPLSDLALVLQKQGARISSLSFPCVVENDQCLQGGNIFISGDISSQFLSGLLMIAPYCQSDVVLQTSVLVSEPYVDMSCNMMQSFGVKIDRDEKKWKVSVGQHYEAQNYWIESDFSTASYFFAAAAVTGGEITILNMQRENSLQGDSKFLDILEKMGCCVVSNHEGITVKGPVQLKGIVADMQHISDTMMTLAAIAPFADSPTRILNIGNARVKESDRIAAMSTNLRSLGIRVDEEASALTIYPGTPASGVINCYQDHRVAMACSLIGLKVSGIIIDDARCVSKTFPEFFEVFLGMYEGATG